MDSTANDEIEMAQVEAAFKIISIEKTVEPIHDAVDSVIVVEVVSVIVEAVAEAVFVIAMKTAFVPPRILPNP